MVDMVSFHEPKRRNDGIQRQLTLEVSATFEGCNSETRSLGVGVRGSPGCGSRSDHLCFSMLGLAVSFFVAKHFEDFQSVVVGIL